MEEKGKVTFEEKRVKNIGDTLHANLKQLIALHTFIGIIYGCRIDFMKIILPRL